MSRKEFSTWGASLWADVCRGLSGPGMGQAIQCQMPGFAAFRAPHDAVADPAARAGDGASATGVQP